MIGLIRQLFTGLFKRPQPSVRPPWYTGPPTFPDSPRVFQPPPPRQPVPSVPSELTSRREPVSAYSEPLNNTRPMQRIDATRPILPAPSVIDPTPLADATRRYDHLFPPPQPGDEDYLEFDHDDTTLIPPEQAKAESPPASELPDNTDTQPHDETPPEPPGSLPD